MKMCNASIFTPLTSSPHIVCFPYILSSTNSFIRAFVSVFGLAFDLTVLAAVLAVIGYSLNDTIVLYDRVRENFRSYRNKNSRDIINQSINQTLSRTLVTSGTTLCVVLALFFLGGELIHGFATALIIGIVVGTYSSIFVASTSLLFLGVNSVDLMPVEKDGEDLENRP